MSTFSDLPLLSSLSKSLKDQGITVPTPIQAQTLPALLQGTPVVGVAETGSGKTLAYCLPMLHQLKTLENNGSSVSESGRPRGLILVPGRELGEQVGRVLKSLTHTTRLRVRTALGGTRKQIARQNVGGKFEVLVATPGRLVQLLDGGTLRLDDVRMLVFDEADQVLDPGFLPVASRIVEDCPHTVQLVLFSATLPVALDAIVAELFVQEPLRVRTRGSHRVVPTLTTDNRRITEDRRLDALASALGEAPDAGTLLFANTRDQCDRIAAFLDLEGIPYVAYRGQMDRQERRDNLKRFRSGEVSVLLSTDLGGRGLDIERIERVINVFLPQDIDNYLHRVGRTARAGRAGLVINLVGKRDRHLITKIESRA